MSVFDPSKTHCPRGHEYSAFRKTSNGRHCKTCHRAHELARYRKNKVLINQRRRERSAEERGGPYYPRIKHGQARGSGPTTEYRTWVAILARCFNQKKKEFRYYGGRGITVCERWQTFENFFADMGVRPAGLSLDRINNDGNYEPGNCRWATRKQQARNRRTTMMVTRNGITGPLRDVCEALGAEPLLVWNRLHRGWNEDDAWLKPKWQRIVAKGMKTESGDM